MKSPLSAVSPLTSTILLACGFFIFALFALVPAHASFHESNASRGEFPAFCPAPSPAAVLRQLGRCTSVGRGSSAYKCGNTYYLRANPTCEIVVPGKRGDRSCASHFGGCLNATTRVTVGVNEPFTVQWRTNGAEGATLSEWKGSLEPALCSQSLAACPPDSPERCAFHNVKVTSPGRAKIAMKVGATSQQSGVIFTGYCDLQITAVQGAGATSPLPQSTPSPALSVPPVQSITPSVPPGTAKACIVKVEQRPANAPANPFAGFNPDFWRKYPSHTWDPLGTGGDYIGLASNNPVLRDLSQQRRAAETAGNRPLAEFLEIVYDTWRLGGQNLHNRWKQIYPSLPPPPWGFRRGQRQSPISPDGNIGAWFADSLRTRPSFAIPWYWAWRPSADFKPPFCSTRAVYVSVPAPDTYPGPSTPPPVISTPPIPTTNPNALRCSITGPTKVRVGERFNVSWSHNSTWLSSLQTLGWYGPIKPDSIKATPGGALRNLPSCNYPGESCTWGNVYLDQPGLAYVSIRAARGNEAVVCGYAVLAESQPAAGQCILNPATDPGKQCSGAWVKGCGGNPGAYGCYNGVRMGANCETPFGPFPPGWTRPAECSAPVPTPTPPPARTPSPLPTLSPEPIAPAEYQAEFVSQNIPSSLQPGQDAVFSVTMKNTGTVTWWRRPGNHPEAPLRGEVYLRTISNARQIVDWGPDSLRTDIPHDVPPGGTITFSVKVKGPVAGVYPHRARLYVQLWSPEHRRSGFFGQRTGQASVTVGNPVTASTACPAGSIQLDRNTTVTGRAGAKAWGGYETYIKEGEVHTYCAIVDVPVERRLAFAQGPTFGVINDQVTNRNMTIVPPPQSGLQIYTDIGRGGSTGDTSHIYQHLTSSPYSPRIPSGNYLVTVRFRDTACSESGPDVPSGYRCGGYGVYWTHDDDSHLLAGAPAPEGGSVANASLPAPKKPMARFFEAIVDALASVYHFLF